MQKSNLLHGLGSPICGQTILHRWQDRGGAAAQLSTRCHGGRQREFLPMRIPATSSQAHGLMFCQAQKTFITPADQRRGGSVPQCVRPICSNSVVRLPAPRPGPPQLHQLAPCELSTQRYKGAKLEGEARTQLFRSVCGSGRAIAECGRRHFPVRMLCPRRETSHMKVASASSTTLP
jgi:hypothetical protein